MRIIFFILSVGFSNVHAFDQQIELTTPRSEAILIDVYNPGASRALVLGPGQGCNPRLDMYDAIGAEAKTAGVTVVRVYWAYCVKGAEGAAPSPDYKNETEDFKTALDYTRKTYSLSDDKIVVGGKSLGTLVSQPIFAANKNFAALILLTPLCTDDTDPAKLKNVFTDEYPGLATETRPVLLAQGNADPLCSTGHFNEFVSARTPNFYPLVVRGNHGFGVIDDKGALIPDLGMKNLKTLAKWIFTWLP